MKAFGLGVMITAVAAFVIFVGYMNSVATAVPPPYLVEVHNQVAGWRATVQGTVDGNAFEAQIHKAYADVLKSHNVKLTPDSDVGYDGLMLVLYIGAIMAALIAVTFVIAFQVIAGVILVMAVYAQGPLAKLWSNQP